MSTLTPEEKQALYKQAFELLDRIQATLEQIECRCHQRTKELGYAPVPKYSEHVRDQAYKRAMRSVL